QRIRAGESDGTARLGRSAGLMSGDDCLDDRQIGWRRYLDVDGRAFDHFDANSRPVAPSVRLLPAGRFYVSPRGTAALPPQTVAAAGRLSRKIAGGARGRAAAC